MRPGTFATCTGEPPTKKELKDVLEIEARHAALEQRVRDLGIQLNAALVGSRRTLRVVLGRSHPHYRALLHRRRGGMPALEPSGDQPLTEGDPATQGEEAQGVA